MTHALFFSLVIGYTPRLVSRADVGRALALVAGGASAGFVLGVPLSTSLGTAVGWRTAFAVLAALSILTFVLVWWVLPSVDHEHASRGTDGVGRGELAAVAASNMLTFLGQFTVYTFVSVLLLASGVSPAFVGPVLLGCGACGLLGLWYVGRNVDQNARRTAVVILAVVDRRGGRARQHVANSGGGDCRYCRLEWSIRGCALDLPNVCGAHACGVTRTRRCVGERHRERGHRWWVGHRRRTASSGRDVVAAVGGRVPRRPRSRCSPTVSQSVSAGVTGSSRGTSSSRLRMRFWRGRSWI